MSSIAQTLVETPFCTLLVEASEKGITKISKVRSNLTLKNTTKPKILKQAESALKSFAEGNNQALNLLPLDLQGTDFQKKVWKELRKIEFGTVCSYREIAQKVGNEKAARAVGTACGKNPLLLAVPCHRVVASSGGLGGFSAGLSTKRALLKFEALKKRN